MRKNLALKPPGTFRGSVLASSGVQLGTLWIMKTAIIPLLDARPYPEYVRNAQLIDMHVFHPIAFWNGILTAALGAREGMRTRSRAARWAYLAGSAGMVAVGLTSEGVNRPIWRQIERWSPDRPEEGWVAKRRRWDRAHDVRTAAALVALVAYGVANHVDRSAP